jgi:Flp pilus assembly protein TadD
VPLFDPQQPLAGSFYAWSMLSADAGRTDEAIAAGREAIRHDPTMPEAHYIVCRLLSGKHEFSEALAECRMAVNLRAAYPKAWNDLGILLAMTGDRRGAAEALIRSLEQEPDDDSARKNLRQVLSLAAQANDRDVQERIESFLREPSPR